MPMSCSADSKKRVLALLRAHLPDEVWAKPKSWPRWHALLPSVLAATGHQADTTREGPAAGLLAHAGTYLRNLGRAGEALPIQKRARCIHEAFYGADHPNVAIDPGPSELHPSQPTARCPERVIGRPIGRHSAKRGLMPRSRADLLHAMQHGFV
jgi:hypothetical protein